MAINTHNKLPHKGYRQHLYALLAILLPTVPAAVSADNAQLQDNSLGPTTLSPYRASYRIAYHNIGSTLERNLTLSSGNRWRLSNSLDLFLVGFKEYSVLRLEDQQVVPLHYHFDNQLSSRRNSDLYFNWTANTVTDRINQRSTALEPNTLDSLSFQLQLRQDLIAAEGQFTEKVYQLADGKRLKDYRVTLMGEEQLTTPAGTFLATKLRQHRPGKKRHTTIWLAKEKAYFLLRLDRVEDQKTTYSLELNEASLGGLPL
ncbi:MAG: hypothetical protein ACI9WS_002023 [Paraglaciecola psychrophila]|jgi:hypothetical protein